MRRLGLLLCLALVARAGDDPVVRVYDIADMLEDEVMFAAAVARAKAAAAGHDVRVEKNTLVVSAPAAVQEKIPKELGAVREALERVFTFELRLVKVDGGLGVASVPADKLEALLTEKRAEATAGPTLTSFDGQQATVSILRPISYVSDFDIGVDEQGNVTADPTVSTIDAGMTAKLRPLSAGQKMRVAVEVSVVEVADPIPEVELPLPLPTPLKIQVPEWKRRSVHGLVECAPGAFTVIDVGEGRVFLLRAIQGTAKRAGQRFPGQEVPLK